MKGRQLLSRCQRRGLGPGRMAAVAGAVRRAPSPAPLGAAVPAVVSLRAALLALVLAAVLLGVRAPALCHAQGGSTPVVTPSDLVAEVRRYDGQQVTLRGEVIGTVMRRGEYVWVNVGDGAIAVGVWAPARILEEIGPGGGYAHKGDTVEVTGTFHAACPLHGGDPDLHAVTWQVVQKGRVQEHSLPPWRWGLAAALAGVGILLTAAAVGLARRS